MPPKNAPLLVQCPDCAVQFNVAGMLRGKTIQCPKCRVSFQAAPAAPSGDKVQARCSSCGAWLKVPPELVGAYGDCPKCRTRVRFENAQSAEEEFTVSKTDGNLLGKEVFLVKGEAKRAFTIMREVNEAAKDSYAKALFKSIIYPFQQLGAILFFVVGVPVVVLLVQLIGQKLLESFARDEAAPYVIWGVTLLMLAGPLAMASFFCSFLMGVVRNSARGGSSAPVAQGAAHRANLAAMCAWMAMYFGMALLIGHWSSGPNAYFRFSGPCLFFFLIGGLAAPMGLLCTATVSVAGGLHLPRVLTAIFTKPGPYFAACLITGLGSALYAWIISALWGQAAQTSGLAAGIWDFLGWLCVPMPLVTMARAVGLFADYNAKSLPFHMDVFADAKAGGFPMVVALVGILLLAQPIRAHSAQYAYRSGVARIAMAGAEDLSAKLKGSGDSIRSRRGTDNTEEARTKPIGMVLPAEDILKLPQNAKWVARAAREADYPDSELILLFRREAHPWLSWAWPIDRHDDDFASPPSPSRDAPEPTFPEGISEGLKRFALENPIPVSADLPFYHVVQSKEGLGNQILVYERYSVYPNAGDLMDSGRVNVIHVSGQVKPYSLRSVIDLHKLADTIEEHGGNDDAIRRYNNKLGNAEWGF